MGTKFGKFGVFHDYYIYIFIFSLTVFCFRSLNRYTLFLTTLYICIKKIKNKKTNIGFRTSGNELLQNKYLNKYYKKWPTLDEITMGTAPSKTEKKRKINPVQSY